ncbi:DUF309 domain-containing protein [Saccharopolyspora elongata]|uniref:Uncharacterized protein n=1 Tax=Saccharopolyspora elongata TaxID=2530387 RepID=A0A4R4Y8T8_9PSEU|nr:hypothetical protein [Saccharopolyspora elongata]TDD40911.1 hypothetical protein E1288_34245 [Saccharopolyspora elongata]
MSAQLKAADQRLQPTSGTPQGLTHLRRGNGTGAAALLRRAHDHIQPYIQQPPYSVAAEQLTHYATDLATRIERDGPDAIASEQLSPQLRTIRAPNG